MSEVPGLGRSLDHPAHEHKDKIVAVTGGDIPPSGHKLAELTGGTVVDGFRSSPLESEIAAVVIDCGGTARCGVYPRKKIPTINLTPVGQSGPLANFITEDTYVSGVTVNTLHPVQGDAAGTAGTATAAGPAVSSSEAAAAPAAPGAPASEGGASGGGGLTGLIAGMGRATGERSSASSSRAAAAR